MSNADELILSIRRRLHVVEEEMKRLARTVGKHDGQIGTLDEQAKKARDAAEELEARMTDHETKHLSDPA